MIPSELTFTMRGLSASRALVSGVLYLSVPFLFLIGSSSAQTTSNTMTTNDLCNVCNPGKVVTDFDALLPAGVDYYIPGVVTCRDAQHLGNLGMIPAAECALLRFQSSIACGCTEASLVPPTVPTAPIPPPSLSTMGPTEVPIMVTTTPTMAPTSLPTTAATTTTPTMATTSVPVPVTTSTPTMLVMPSMETLVPVPDTGSTEAPIVPPVATSSPVEQPTDATNAPTVATSSPVEQPTDATNAPTDGDDKEQSGDDDEEDGDGTILDLDRNVFYAVIAGICLAVIFCFALACMVFRRPAPVSPIIVTESSPSPEDESSKLPPAGTLMAYPPIESHEPPVAPLASRLAVETARIGLSDIPVSEGSTASSLSSLRQDMSSRKVIAPAGKLGLVIDTTLEGARIHSVSETSPLYGQAFVGDLILTINDVDTRAMTGAALSSLMVQTARAPRELVLLSEDVTAPSITALLASRPPAPLGLSDEDPDGLPDEDPADGDDDEQPVAPRRKLVMLFSSMPMNRQVTSQQDRAITALNAHGILYDMLDGATHPDLREELFEVSPLERGVYPQWFWVDLDTGHATFWGDWEVFSLSNENGRLLEDFGGGEAP